MAEKQKNEFTYKGDRPWPNKRLKRAAIIGHTTPTTARVWFRTGQPGLFSMLHFAGNDGKAEKWFEDNKESEFLPGKIPKSIQREGFKTDWREDTTKVVDLKGLPTGEMRRYALYSHAQKRIVLGHDRVYAFMTPSHAEEKFRFGLFSCHMPFEAEGEDTTIADMNMWRLMALAVDEGKETRPDFFIAGGDQCYTDGVDTINIWKYLRKVMKKDGAGKLLPDADAMRSWYRDIYRGYWGFKPVQKIFSSFPTYMIWDDHELVDGWGSHYLARGKEEEVDEILPNPKGAKARALSVGDRKELIHRMVDVGKEVYEEYEHSHNPDTNPGEYDYHFSHKGCAFYVLDGRGCRDVDRKKNRILGAEQMARFKNRVDEAIKKKAKFLFVVSAVPVLHWRASIINREDLAIVDKLNMQDDFRDSWEWEKHRAERKTLMDILFHAASTGMRVAILSGDVHLSAAFAIKRDGHTIYQLTSSPITYNVGRAAGWLSGKLGVPNEGTTEDGESFKRLALYAAPSYAMVEVMPKDGQAVFQIYGYQEVHRPQRLRQGRNDDYYHDAEGANKAKEPILASMSNILLWGNG